MFGLPDAARDFSQHLVPKINGTLSQVDTTLQSISAMVDVSQVMLPIITFAVIVYLLGQLYLALRKLNCDYLRLHYGDDIVTMTKTYISLINFLSQRVHETSVVPPMETKVVLVGANEEVESCIWDWGDDALRNLLFRPRFIFRTITEAMDAVDKHGGLSGATSKPKESATAFVFILISPQDPSIFGPHCHKPFRVPPSLHNRYLIIGTGFHDVAAHKLSSSSVGTDGKPLATTLPMGAKKAGVVFSGYSDLLS